MYIYIYIQFIGWRKKYKYLTLPTRDKNEDKEKNVLN